MDAAREKVRAWMAGHPGGTLDQMAADLKGEYGEFADDMAIVLRGLMAYIQDHPEELTGTGLAGQIGIQAGGSATQPSP
jgi:hypothetical protein